MPAPRRCRPRALRPQARAVCVASRGHVHRQHRHRLLAAAAREHAALLQRRADRGASGRGLAPVPVPRPGPDHPLLDRDARVREARRAHRLRDHGADMTRAIAVIDGEHYPDVVRQALEELPYDFCAAVLIGGKEKLRGGETYGVPLAPGLEQAVAEHAPEVVVDLSDEPVLGPAERFRLASRALALGVPYAGADFRLDPPAFVPLDVPSIAVAGTGKRVGKTAVTGKLAPLAAEAGDVAVVSMGRGGPLEPEVVEQPPTVDELVERSRAGAHAASDYLETAVVAGVLTVGCRRCGGGLAGDTWVSNVVEGLALAASRGPELVICDGSGAALPPVAADARVLVASALQGGE